MLDSFAVIYSILTHLHLRTPLSVTYSLPHFYKTAFHGPITKLYKVPWNTVKTVDWRITLSLMGLNMALEDERQENPDCCCCCYYCSVALCGV